MPTPVLPDQAPAGKEVATLGGGCFWCLEAVYDQLKGVESVESGYMGGHIRDPGYEAVCGGDTGHAEVVRITFDPGVISFREILDVFFVIHDPTTLNRQGNDIGTQYRSAIFYHSDAQHRIAEDAMAQLVAQNIWDRPLTTQLTPAVEFWEAESYHQKYFQSNPQQSYCAYVVEPKVAKFRKQFFNQLKK